MMLPPLYDAINQRTATHTQVREWAATHPDDKVVRAVLANSLRTDFSDILIRPTFGFLDAAMPTIEYAVYYTPERLQEEKAKKAATTCLKVTALILTSFALYYITY